MEKMLPSMQAKTAHNVLLFAMVVRDAIINQKIPSQIFNEIVPLSSEGEIFTYITPKWITTDLRGEANNLMFGAEGVCFTGLDSALDDAFGGKKGKNKNHLRSIIFMVRCAFAHNPLLPAWHIKTWYLKTYRIDEINLILDFRALNGQYLDTSQFGGWKGIFDLIDYTVTFLQNMNIHTAENAK